MKLYVFYAKIIFNFVFYIKHLITYNVFLNTVLSYLFKIIVNYINE